jgi:hypothetical protein
LILTPQSPARDVLPELESILRAIRDGDETMRKAGVVGLEQLCRRLRAKEPSGNSGELAPRIHEVPHA